MTETAEIPPTDHPSQPLFVRPREGRMISGVCAGIARKWNLDVTLVRVVAVVATLASGVGFAAYIAAWLLTPADDSPAPLRPDSPAAQFASRTGDRLARRGPAILGIVLAALVVSWFVHALWWNWGAPIGLFLVLMLVALVVGTRRGRWLLVGIVAIVAALIGTVGIFGPHFGTRTYHVSSVDELRSSYEYGAGKVNLDLSSLTVLDGRHRTEVRLGRGDVHVTVPDDQAVVVHARSGFGSVTVDGHEVSGIDAEQTESLGDAAQTAEDRLVVDVLVGAGSVDVSRG